MLSIQLVVLSNYAAMAFDTVVSARVFPCFVLLLPHLFSAVFCSFLRYYGE